MDEPIPLWFKILVTLAVVIEVGLIGALGWIGYLLATP